MALLCGQFVPEAIPNPVAIKLLMSGLTCTKHLKLRCSLSLTFNLVKIM